MTRRFSLGTRGAAPNVPTIETDRLILRKMTRDDAEAMFSYASDPEVTRHVVWDTHRALDDTRAFLDLTVRGYESGADPAWGLVYKGDRRFVGTCGFASLEPEHARAEVGYVISKEYWGRGFAAEALRAMISFGLDRLNLNRIEARCIAENTASARVMQKAGMTHEGTLRQREFIKGSYRDMEMYAILKGERRPR